MPVTEESKTISATNDFEIIWSDDSQLQYAGYLVVKTCGSGKEPSAKCEISVKRGNRTFAQVKGLTNYWLRFGFFNFLGPDKKQLVINKYWGGTHGCSDYLIIDLKPKFRVLYDSRDLGGCSDVGGDELTPADINHDGIFEFERLVTSHENLGVEAACCRIVSAPVVFAYEPKTGRYEISNRKYSRYILDNSVENLSEHEPIDVRSHFMNLVYAGKKDDAWRYFDKEYNFEDRNEYRHLVRQEFASSLVYRSIYNR